MESLKLPFTFDADLINKEIAQFTKEDYYNIYNPSLEVDTLWAIHLIEPIIGEDGLPIFLPNQALKKCPYLLKILNTFECKKETFRVHILNPGARIRPHRDPGYRFEDGKIRLHIPVQTNTDVQLLIDGKPIKMKERECWYCNFHIKHEVYNRSDQPRIHLILDCMVNDWLKTLFARTIQNSNN